MTAITNRSVRRRIAELDLDTRHLPSRHYSPTVRYTEEALREAVAASTSVGQVLRRFGVRPVGSTYAHVRRQIERFGIDMTHFVRTTAGRSPSNKLSPDQVFVVMPPESRRQVPKTLRRALFEIGVPYSCAECGCDGTWRGKPLTLDVDHINGEWRDNRRGNLRLLCPNCHSQTDTWRSMNFRRRRSAPQSDLVGDLG